MKETIKIRIYSPKNLHTDVYRSLIHNSNTCKQLRCLSVGEWINKLWYIQIMKYYSALKRNEPANHKRHRINLDAYY